MACKILCPIIGQDTRLRLVIEECILAMAMIMRRLSAGIVMTWLIPVPVALNEKPTQIGVDLVLCVVEELACHQISGTILASGYAITTELETLV